MQSSSSTSNFEFGPSERVPRRKVPWAALVVLPCILLTEWALDANRQWFADEAVWQWEAKQMLAADGRLDGQVVILGSSVLFHGLDPTPANESLPADKQTANLALNGMVMQHRAQELRDRLASGAEIDTGARII